MKYEEPDLEIVLFDDVYTTTPGMSNSDDEGTSEELPI